MKRTYLLLAVWMLTACASPATPAPSPTALPTAPLQIVVLPTVPLAASPTAPLPQPSTTPASASTEAPAPTQVPPTNAPTSAPTGPTLEIFQDVNVRSGPGTVYPALGRLNAGDAPALKGRNAIGDWFAIDYGGQTGWVAGFVVRFSGDLNALAVVAAPPVPTSPPQPTSPPVPPTQPPATGRLSGSLALCNPAKTTYAVGERICFVETVRNTTANNYTLGIVGVLAAGPVNQFQTSWSGAINVRSGCTGPTDGCNGPWEDGMRLNTAGTYSLRLQVCYSDQATCASPSGDWESLGPSIQITVQ